MRPQENSFGEDATDDGDHKKEPFFQFRLPEDDFGDHMFARRLAPQSSSSPSALAHQLLNETIDPPRRPSTIEDTEGKEVPARRPLNPIANSQPQNRDPHPHPLAGPNPNVAPAAPQTLEDHACKRKPTRLPEDEAVKRRQLKTTTTERRMAKKARAKRRRKTQLHRPHHRFPKAIDPVRSLHEGR